MRKDLGCNAPAPGSIRLGSFSTPEGAGISHFEDGGLRIRQIKGNIIEHHEGTQFRNQRFQRRLPVCLCRRLAKKGKKGIQPGGVHPFSAFSPDMASRGNLKVEPLPLTEATSSMEPWASTIWRTSERPMPVPAYLRVEESSS